MLKNIKKWVSLAAAIAASFTMLAQTATALEANVYEIGTAEELAAFRDSVNSGTDYSGKTVKLTADINLGNAEWTGIGYPNAFRGVFDGQGHTVSGLNAPRSALFEVVPYGATLKNVIVDGNSSDTAYAAVTVSNGGLIEGCGNTGNIVVAGTTTFDTPHGACGIAHFNGTYGIIRRCFNTGWIKGNHYTAGIVGSNDGTVEDCYNEGAIASVGILVGGIVGTIQPPDEDPYDGIPTIKNCHNAGPLLNYGNANNTHAFGPIIGVLYDKRCPNGYVIENNYYNALSLPDGGNSFGGESRPSEDFNSGTIRDLLNGTRTGDAAVWAQEIDVDENPVFAKQTVKLDNVNGLSYKTADGITSNTINYGQTYGKDAEGNDDKSTQATGFMTTLKGTGVSCNAIAWTIRDNGDITDTGTMKLDGTVTPNGGGVRIGLIVNAMYSAAAEAEAEARTVIE